MTQVVHSPTASGDTSGSGSGGSDKFFANTGAVAGTFVVVGLAIMAGLLSCVIFMLKRRRRQRLDRDVAAAAASASPSSHHSRSNFDDDEDEKAQAVSPNFGYYGGGDLHTQPTQPMHSFDYEDPSGGYDHYASTLPAVGDRSSIATAPGVAGFGAQSAQATYHATHHNVGYTQDGYEDLADANGQQPSHGYNAVTTDATPNNNGYYFDPNQAGAYAEEDASAGYNDHRAASSGHHHSGSDGTLSGGQGGQGGGLKVTNV